MSDGSRTSAESGAIVSGRARARRPARARAARGFACGTVRALLVALPVPLVLVVAVTASAAATVWAAVAVVVAAVSAATVSRRCAERRMRDDVRAHERELAHTKRQILALVSHELRTPVTGVVGFSRTLAGRLDDLDRATLRLFVDAIDEHSNRLARLIDNVLVASRTPLVPAGGVCRLSSTLSTAVDRLALRPEDAARLQIRLDGCLGALIDEEAAVRVLTNLVDNALKFGDPESVVEIHGRVRGDRVLLQVGNTGSAIPLGLRAALYDPFVQGDATDTRSADGLGLGLHVVRQLVEAHGGTIDLVDHPRLVVFQVSLPASRPAVSGDDAPVAASPVADRPGAQRDEDEQLRPADAPGADTRDGDSLADAEVRPDGAGQLHGAVEVRADGAGELHDGAGELHGGVAEPHARAAARRSDAQRDLVG